jgi:hypothetical protein
MNNHRSDERIVTRQGVHLFIEKFGKAAYGLGLGDVYGVERSSFTGQTKTPLRSQYNNEMNPV